MVQTPRNQQAHAQGDGAALDKRSDQSEIVATTHPAYTLPAEAVRLKKLLRKQFDDANAPAIHSSGTVQTVLVSDPKSLAVFRATSNEFESAFSWEEFGLQFANGLVSGGAGWVIGTLLDMLRPPQTIELHENALRAIRSTFKEVIDDAFLGHYMGEVTGIRGQLLTYGETNDVARLNSALDRGFDLVPRLYGLNIKGLGGFMMAANLHLAALHGKAQLDGGYQATYDRYRNDYASMGIQLANAARERLEHRVETCTVHPKVCRRQECEDASAYFHFDWGDGLRTFSRSETDEVRRECEAAREVYYRGGTLGPIQNQINPIVAVCNTWVS